MATDFTFAPLEILQLYGYRFRIELGFRQAVHVLGAYAYHFWMWAMKPLRRGDGNQCLHRTTAAYRAATLRKMRSFHLQMQLGCIAQGLPQHLAINHAAKVWRAFRGWLRTMNPALPPSELVTANALRTAIPEFISSPGMAQAHREQRHCAEWFLQLSQQSVELLHCEATRLAYPSRCSDVLYQRDWIAADVQLAGSHRKLHKLVHK